MPSHHFQPNPLCFPAAISEFRPQTLLTLSPSPCAHFALWWGREGFLTLSYGCRWVRMEMAVPGAERRQVGRWSCTSPPMAARLKDNPTENGCAQLEPFRRLKAQPRSVNEDAASPAALLAFLWSGGRQGPGLTLELSSTSPVVPRSIPCSICPASRWARWGTAVLTLGVVFSPYVLSLHFCH